MEPPEVQQTVPAKQVMIGWICHEQSQPAWTEFDLLAVGSVGTGKMKTLLLLSGQAVQVLESHFRKAKMSHVP